MNAKLQTHKIDFEKEIYLENQLNGECENVQAKIHSMSSIENHLPHDLEIDSQLL